MVSSSTSFIHPFFLVITHIYMYVRIYIYFLSLFNRDAKALQDKIAQKEKLKAEGGGGGGSAGGGGGDKKKEKNAYTVFIK